MSGRALFLLLALIGLDLLAIVLVSSIPPHSPLVARWAPSVLAQRQEERSAAMRAPAAAEAPMRDQAASPTAAPRSRTFLPRPERFFLDIVSDERSAANLSPEARQALRRAVAITLAEIQAGSGMPLSPEVRESVRRAAEGAAAELPMPRPGAPPAGADPAVTATTTVERLPLHPFGLHFTGAQGVALHIAALTAFGGLLVLALAFLREPLLRWAAPLAKGWRYWLGNLALGLAGYLAAGVLVFLLLITVVGVPVAWLFLVIVGLLSLGGLAALCLGLGQLLARGLGLAATPWWWSGLAGLAVLFLVSLLPYVGWALFALALVAGFGAGLRSRFGSASGWQAELQPPSL